MPHSHGFRVKTRHLLRKRLRLGLSRILTQYHINDKIVIDIDRSMVKGMPHRRFQGKVGVVEKINRRALALTVPIGNKAKKITARFEHVKPLAGSKK